MSGEAISLINAVVNLSGVFSPTIFGSLANAFLNTAYPGGFLAGFMLLVIVSLILSWRLPSNEAIEEIRKGFEDQEVVDCQQSG